MLSLRNRTVKRLRRRAEKTITAWQKEHGREPTLADIQSLPVLGAFERIGFVVIGGIFLWIALLLVSDDFWMFPSFILPVAGYVTVRGVLGHELKIRSGGSSGLATPEGIVASAEDQLTSAGRKLLAVDMCFVMLLIIIELFFALLGAVVSLWS